MLSNNYPLFARLLEAIGLDEAFLIKKAMEVCWLVRKPRSITPGDLLGAIYNNAGKNSPSYNDVASMIDIHTEKRPSRQAVAKRMDEECQQLFKCLIEKAFEHKLTSPRATPSKEFLNDYKRVLVQDSTIIQLPDWLYETFSGVSNGSSTRCNCRIQAIYDIKNKVLIDFSIDPYSKNDLTAAPELELQEGDLALRDRGYLTKDELQRHIHNQTDFIYRHKTGTVYLDPITEEPIELLNLLRKTGFIDQVLVLNNKEKTRVRIVAARVDTEIANTRRMKAKKESKGKNPSKATLALMDWTIFITTLCKEKASMKTLLSLYGLRWRIEIIFKAWKSHMSLGAIHRVCKTQLMIILRARLLRIIVFTNCLYRNCYQIVLRLYQSHLSILKFLNELQKNPERVEAIYECLFAPGVDDCATIWHCLKKYCCYDKRTRLNYHQICYSLA